MAGGIERRQTARPRLDEQLMNLYEEHGISEKRRQGARERDRGNDGEYKKNASRRNDETLLVTR